jgi:4-hydroxybenzoate polyprenyltransferase/phosphoserine phosphatase
MGFVTLNPEHMEVPVLYIAPICVDLDGTLVATDTLVESFLLLLKDNPRAALGALPLTLGNRASFKRRIAEKSALNAALLPYREDLLEYLRAEALKGRKLYLVTGADSKIAAAVADHLGIFHGVIASDGRSNNTGSVKAEAIRATIEPGEFYYAGNSSDDLAVWRHSGGAIVVDASKATDSRLKRAGVPVVRTFRGRGSFRLSRVLRVQQWVKNVLVLVPLILHHAFDLETVREGVVGFLAFSLGASAIYILNDLLDLQSDRSHPVKKYRPFSSGDVSVGAGILLSGTLFAAAAALSFLLPGSARSYLLGYCVLAILYSFYLKSILLLDVFVLAVFYTLRILFGASATSIPLSVWTLAYAMFTFISLALMKRLGELRLRQSQGLTELSGRAYRDVDLTPIVSLAAASSLVAVLVMVLYINSPEAEQLYRHPQILWLDCPVMAFWFSRLLALANRGDMHDDPVRFAITDKVSVVVAAMIVLIGIATIY